jgi:hypothetical protein
LAWVARSWWRLKVYRFRRGAGGFISRYRCLSSTLMRMLVPVASRIRQVEPGDATARSLAILRETGSFRVSSLDPTMVMRGRAEGGVLTVGSLVG